MCLLLSACGGAVEQSVSNAGSGTGSPIATTTGGSSSGGSSTVACYCNALACVNSDSCCGAWDACISQVDATFAGCVADGGIGEGNPDGGPTCGMVAAASISACTDPGQAACLFQADICCSGT